MPLNRVSSLNRISRTFSDLEQKYQREPTEEELADVLDISADEVSENLKLSNKKVSMDAPFVNGEGNSLLDVIENEEIDETDSDLMVDSLRREVQRALSTLTTREATVISNYYGLNGEHAMTLEEIGEQLGLTRERVRQIKEKGTKKLRHSSRSKILKTYLG